MALRNDKEVKQGRNVAILWTVLAYTGAFAIGIAAIALYDQGSFGDVETLLPTMILQFMPPWIAGLLLAGVLAAIISTANSQLVVVTGSVTEDIINQALGIKLTEKQLLWLSRFSVLFFGAIGMVIALVSESLLYLVVGWAWAGVGCTLSPAIIMAFFWKRYSSAGVIATIVSGLLSTILWISTPLEEMMTSPFHNVLYRIIFRDRL